MPEVLEIERPKTEEIKNQETEIASWLADIPLNIIESLNLEKGSRIAVTINNGKVSGDVLPPMSPELKKISTRILERRREVFEELKRLGD